MASSIPVVALNGKHVKRFLKLVSEPLQIFLVNFTAEKSCKMKTMRSFFILYNKQQSSLLNGLSV